MSRHLRIKLAGGLYHVTSKGDRREAIARNDPDRSDWIALLGDVCIRFNWRCHPPGTAARSSRAQSRLLAKPLADFAHRSPVRREAMARAFQTGVYSMQAIADYFSRTLLHRESYRTQTGSRERFCGLLTARPKNG